MRRLIGLVSGLLLLMGMVTIAQAQDNIVHVVQRGENLYRISLRYGVSISQIAAANNISNINLIFAGQELVIPGTTGGDGGTDGGSDDGDDGGSDGGTGGTYTVVAGDTLSRIARRFNTTVSAIAAANNIANVNLIFRGQVLTIPGTSGGDGGTDGGTDGGSDGGGTPVTGFSFGGQVLQSGYPYSDLMRETGMTWVKRQVRWSQGQSASAFQGEIDAAKSRGFRVLLTVLGDPGQLAANPSQYYQDYANFVGGLAAGGADAIEVWNEPNIPREWPAGSVGGAQYTQMLTAAYQAIKAQNNATLVISGAPAPTGGLPNNATQGYNDDVFLQQMRNAGATNFMDCVGIHYNAGTVPPSATSGAPVGSASHYSWYYPSMVNLYRNTFPTRPLCFTEIGYLTSDGFNQGLPANFSWASGTSVQEQAQWLAQAATRARNSGTVRLFIIWNVDSTTYGADPQAGYAIVRPDGTCPACNTLRAAVGG